MIPDERYLWVGELIECVGELIVGWCVLAVIVTMIWLATRC